MCKSSNGAVGRRSNLSTLVAIDALAGRLEDGDGSVRRAAVRALAQVAERGNSAAIRAVAGRVEN